MWLTANWPFVALGVVTIIAFVFLVLYLSSRAEQAKISIGAGPLSFDVDMRSNERHVTEDDFNKIDPKKFYVDSLTGFVIRQPFSPDWVVIRANVGDLWEEKGFSEEGMQFLNDTFLVTDPANNTCVTCFRRGSKQSVKYTADTMLNARPIDPEVLDQIKEIFEGGEELIYDQIVILALRKDACKIKLGLLDLFVREMAVSQGMGPKRLSVNPENTVLLMDCSAIFKNIEYNGQRGDHVINNTFLVQENSSYFFEIIVTYVQAGDKPPKVWNELTNYLNSFRVLAK